MTPLQLKNESAKAFHAFKIYCDLGTKRSLVKVGKRLGVSRQALEKWSKRHAWQKRLRQLELDECKRAIAADEQAKLNIAEERERLALRHASQKIKAAEKLFDRAHEILKQPAKSSADSARMFAVAAMLGDSVLNVGFASLGPAPAMQITTAFFDERGEPIESPSIENVSLDQLEALAAKLHAKPAELPCSNWSPNDKDASPVVAEPAQEEPPAPPEPSSSPPLPSRISTCPTSDGKGADGTGVQPEFVRGMQRIHGV
jgi:hypothetical protein